MFVVHYLDVMNKRWQPTKFR